MTRNLNFAKLVPERDTFTDADGKVYEFKTQLDFGVLDLARIQRLQDALRDSLKVLGESVFDDASAKRFEQCADEMVACILPDLPVERRQQMAIGQKAAVVKWWSEKSAELAPDPKAQTPAPLPN